MESSTRYPQQWYNDERVPTGRPKGPRTLGVVGLVLASLAMVGGGVVAVALGDVMVRLVNSLAVDITPGDAPGVGPDVGAYLINILLLGLAGLVGIAALIMSIVATAINRGRGQGIAGIVVACLAPVLCTVVLLFIVLAGLDGNLEDVQRQLDELNQQDVASVLPFLTARFGL